MTATIPLQWATGALAIVAACFLIILGRQILVRLAQSEAGGSFLFLATIAAALLTVTVGAWSIGAVIWEMMS